MEVWAGIEPAYTRFAGAAVTVPATTPFLEAEEGFEPSAYQVQSRLLFHLSYSAMVGIGKKLPIPSQPQSLKGSNTSAPAITTAKGRNVCSILTVPAWQARTSGSRR